MVGDLTGGLGDVGVVSSMTGLVTEGCVAVLRDSLGGVMEAAPWLFSERDVRDLM